MWAEEPAPLLAPPDFGIPDLGSIVADASDVVQLSDGRLRLYLQVGGTRCPPECAVTRSAVSLDGLHWTAEPGVRCQETVCGGQSTVVAIPSGGWRLFGGKEGGISSAITEDGLTFTSEPGLRVRFADYPMRPGWQVTGAHVVKAKEGGWRMYFSDSFGEHYVTTPLTQVFSAHSDDLLNWTPDAGVRFGGVIHPSVVLRDDGSYQMFANGLGQAGIDASGIATATSDDGLSWTSLQSTGLQGGDPVAHRMPDGQLRLYFEDQNFFAPSLARFFSARIVIAPWGVSVQRSPLGGPLGEGRYHIKLGVQGSGAAITVRAVDRARQTHPIAGLPFTGAAPFQVEFDIQQSLDAHVDQLIEVSDGTITRHFQVPGSSTSD